MIETILHRELNGSASQRILSVGCGPAEWLQWLTPFAGSDGKVVGLDIEAIHANGLQGNLGFVVGSLEQSPIADESFDVVMALDVLEHLDDDSAGLREAARMVKPGGLLLITVPALPSLWGGQDVVSEHRRRYTKRALKRLFEEVGLTGHRISYFNTLLFPLAAGVRWSRRALGKANRARSDFEDNRPGVVNEVLARVFSAESYLIKYAPMPVGVSLLATYRPDNK